MARGTTYNGWTQAARRIRSGEYYYARDHGVLGSDPYCRLCRADLPPKCIPYHSEQYGPTLEDFFASCIPMCNRCHGMLHARFKTPNRWKRLLAQGLDGVVDEKEYPPQKQMKDAKRYFAKREDAGLESMPEGVDPLLAGLSLTEYAGPEKVALLKVRDPQTGKVLVVPDWRLYGEDSAALPQHWLDSPDREGVDVYAIAEGRLTLPASSRRHPKLIRYFMTVREGIAKATV